MIPENFHFLRPEWLWLLPLPAGLLIYFWRQQGSSGYWQVHCDPHLLPHLLHGQMSRPRRLPLVLLGICWLLALLALAGPTWERLPQPLFRPQHPVVIVLDLSQSMAATDVRPSRLARAKQKVLDLLTHTSGGQTGLVAFAGDAFIVSPLTDDVRTLAALIPDLTVAGMPVQVDHSDKANKDVSRGTMPVQGSRPDSGLRQATALLERAALGTGTVILIVDGDAAPTESFQAARALVAAGHRLSVLGVGTPQGGLVPRPDGRGFLSDASGRRVLAKLNRERLAALSQFGPGVYTDLTADDSDLEQMLGRSIRDQSPTSARALERLADNWREMGPWLLVGLVPLAALAFRRGWLLLWLFLFVIPLRPAQAFEWIDLWQRRDQQGAAALEQGDAAQAAELFQSPGWQGIARYKAEDYAGAAEAFSRTPGADGFFNQGNALARQGKLEEAIRAYEEALKKNPDSEDARFNRDLVKKVLEQQQQKQGDNQKQPDDQKQDNKQSDKNQQGKQGEQEKQGQEQEKSQSGENNSSTGEKNQSVADGSEEEEAQEEQRAAEREAQKKQAEQLHKKSAKEDEKSEGEGDETAAAKPDSEVDNEHQETDQAMSQWLTRIPDDPGGLLRRKFHRQYRRRTQQRTEPNRVETAPW